MTNTTIDSDKRKKRMLVYKRGLATLAKPGVSENLAELDGLFNRVEAIDARTKGLRKNQGGTGWAAIITAILLTLLILAAIFMFLFLPWLKKEISGEIKTGQNQQSASMRNEITEMRMLAEIDRLKNRAIADSHRDSYGTIAQLRDKAQNEKIRGAARAGCLEVQRFYERGSHMPPNYHIPVEKILPGEGYYNERQLSITKVAAILLDKELDWKDRARAAQLLRNNITGESMRALIESIESEPVLAVLRESIYSFRVNADYWQGDMLDAGGIQKWWSENAHSLILVE